MLLFTDETTFELPMSIFIIRLKNIGIDSLKIEDLNKKEILRYLHNEEYDWYTNLLSLCEVRNFSP